MHHLCSRWPVELERYLMATQIDDGINGIVCSVKRDGACVPQNSGLYSMWTCSAVGWTCWTPKESARHYMSHFTANTGLTVSVQWLRHSKDNESARIRRVFWLWMRNRVLVRSTWCDDYWKSVGTASPLERNTPRVCRPHSLSATLSNADLIQRPHDSDRRVCLKARWECCMNYLFIFFKAAVYQKQVLVVKSNGLVHQKPMTIFHLIIFVHGTEF